MLCHLRFCLLSPGNSPSYAWARSPPPRAPFPALRSRSSVRSDRHRGESPPSRREFASHHARTWAQTWETRRARSGLSFDHYGLQCLAGTRSRGMIVAKHSRPCRQDFPEFGFSVVQIAALAHDDGSNAALAAVRFACSQLGKPYVWGGNGDPGFDCSGLTRAAYAAAGVGIPRTAQTQRRSAAPRRNTTPAWRSGLLRHRTGLSDTCRYRHLGHANDRRPSHRCRRPDRWCRPVPRCQPARRRQHAVTADDHYQ